MHLDAQNRWVSDDGRWVWDGAAWQPQSPPPGAGPLDGAPAPADSPAQPDLQAGSDEGHLRWDGARWQPVNAPSPPITTPIVSTDGRWEWDGTAWQPVSQPGSVGAGAGAGAGAAENSKPAAVAELVAAGNPVSTDGRWVWNGQAWVATGH